MLRPSDETFEHTLEVSQHPSDGRGIEQVLFVKCPAAAALIRRNRGENPGFSSQPVASITRRKPTDPAILKLTSDESTEWYLPS